MRLLILLHILSAVYIFGTIFYSYNRGFSEGYVMGLVAQGLGLDSFENYDMPYTNVDNHKRKW